MIAVAVICGSVVITAVLAIALIARHIRRLPQTELGGYEAQSPGYTAMLVAYAALAAAAIGGCIAVWEGLRALGS